jgi:hypothetical protein
MPVGEIHEPDFESFPVTSIRTTFQIPSRASQWNAVEASWARDGKVGKPIPEGGDADQVWYDPGSDNYYYFSRISNVAAVNAARGKFVTSIPLGSHSIAANARNQHVFVPVAGKGIFVVKPKGQGW